MTSHEEAAADIITSRSTISSIDTIVLLGTGLGSAMEDVEDACEIPYADLPGFPAVSISGHEGKLVLGTQEGKTVAYLHGRSHYYETGDPRGMAAALETLALFGAQNIIITSAAGSVDADMVPGSMVLITDHINFSGLNPLVSIAGDGGFVSLTHAYDVRLARRLKAAAAGGGVTLREGIYMWFSGPTFETPAEVRMARMLGANVIGMSTVPEVILARRIGMNVGAIAAVTNFGAGFRDSEPSHIETREIARQAGISMRRLLTAFMRTGEQPLAERSSILRKPIS